MRLFFLFFFFSFALSSASVFAAGSDGAALSDPEGSGRPPHRDQPALSALSTRIELHGYFRTRWDLFHNLDLGHGPTPSTQLPLFPRPPGGGSLQNADMRFRLDLDIEIGSTVRLFARVDALDNLVLGSTPEGLPRSSRVPSIVATPGQEPPSSGFNALQDSIRFKWAYGEVLLPFGYLSAGRMGAFVPWGLGLLVNPGNGLDDDRSDVADRISLVLALFGHLLLVAYEFSASGPILGLPDGTHLNQDPRDDVRSIGVAFARYDPPDTLRRKLLAGQTVVNYGLLFSYRYQDLDVPALYGGSSEWMTDQRIQKGDSIQRAAWSFVLDAWFLLRTPVLRIELEAVYAQAEIGNASLVPGVNLTRPITSQQFGGALQIAFSPLRSPWGIGVEVGLASGDDAPGFGVQAPLNQLRTVPGDFDGPQINYPRDSTSNNFRFHPNYRVDLIFWRRMVGQITDALYLKASGHFDITPRLRFWLSGIYSRSLEASTPPGGSNDLGVEVNAGFRYDYDPCFDLRLTFGAFFPLAGLRNVLLALEPQPALALHLILGYVF